MDDPVVILSGSLINQNSLVVKRSISLLSRETTISIFPSIERILCSNKPRESPQYIGFSWIRENPIYAADISLLFGKDSIPKPAADQRGDWSSIF